MYSLMVLPVIMLLGSGSLYAADENWATRGALGDVLVTRAGFVAVYGNDGSPKHTITLAGDNREIAFDIFLNAYVANVNGTTGRIVKLPAALSHAPDFAAVTFTTNGLVDSTYNLATPIPRSLAFDRLQNLWVGLDNTKAMAGGKFAGVIQRYAKNTEAGPYVLQQEFSVQSDGGPISLDVYVKEQGFPSPTTPAIPVVNYTSRGSNIFSLDTTKSVNSTPAQNSAVVRTLSGTGAAAQLRFLLPGKAEGAETGGFVVAYTRDFRFITSAGVERTCNFSDSLGVGTRQRLHVELDSNPLFWWAADAGTGDWRKLDFTAACSESDSIATGFPSGGGSVNGGLRVGPHLSFMTFDGNKKTARIAEFLDTSPTQPGGFAHAVSTIVNNNTAGQIRAAAWFVEVLSDGICDPTPVATENAFSLTDVDCRSVTNFWETKNGNLTTVPKGITGTSRTREHYVWIHEITTLPAPPQGFGINVSVIYFAEPTTPEPVCPLSSSNKAQVRATWLLDDFGPDLDQAVGGPNPVVFDQFDANTLGAYFRDPTTSTGTKTTFNHYFVARGCVPFTGFFDPMTNTQTVGSSLTLTFSVRDATNLFQTGLANLLNVTVAYKANGKPVADRFGYSGAFLSGTGILPVTEQMSAERYKINVFLDPKIFLLLPGQSVTTFEFCVNADGETTGVQEFCTPVNVKAGGKK
jgi:hypothetical protein